MEITKKSPKDILYIGRVAGPLTSEALGAPFAQAWGFFFDNIIPENALVRWDYVRIEVWSDSARLIVFPAASDVQRRVEKSGFQLLLDDWESLWDDARAKARSDEEFDRLIVGEERRVAGLLVAAMPSTEKLRVRVFSGPDENQLFEHGF